MKNKRDRSRITSLEYQIKELKEKLNTLNKEKKE